MARARLPRRVARVLCLDFVNTADYLATDRPVDYLVAPEVLVDWAEAAGAVDGVLAGAIRGWVAGHPGQAERQLRGLLTRRDALYRVLRAAATGDPAGDEIDRRRVADWVAAARAHALLVPDRPTWRWEWPSEASLRRACWPAAASAGDLLTGGAIGQLGICDNPGCGWLYLDTTKNRSRRWCSMQLCGNLAKSRRHAARSRRARR